MENEKEEITLQRNRSSQSKSRRSKKSLLQGINESSSKKKSDKDIRYFSMFTGVGGFELGISKAWEKKKDFQTNRSNGNAGNGGDEKEQRFTCVGFSEIDKYASELLKQKFPEVRNYGDATKINPAELPNFDMLCGGFPCQAFSIA